MLLMHLVVKIIATIKTPAIQTYLTIFVTSTFTDEPAPADAGTLSHIHLPPSES